MFQPYTRLKGVPSFTAPGFDDQLIENLIAFFDWSFLCLNGFYNISHSYGERCILKPSDNPLIYESSKANWVWESSIGTIPYASIQPVVIDGIYIDDNFSANNGSTYYINYNYGQVIFNEAPDPNSVVKLSYSYKRYNFYNANNEWFKQVIFDPMEEDTLVEVLAKNRVYLPAIIVEYIPVTRMIPYQIGSGVDYYYNQDIIFHILSDSSEDRNKASFALVKQFDKTIHLYDVDKIAESDDFPLDLNGTPKPEAKLYPDLVDSYYYSQALFKSIYSEEITNQLALFRASVRATIQINLF